MLTVRYPKLEKPSPKPKGRGNNMDRLMQELLNDPNIFLRVPLIDPIELGEGESHETEDYQDSLED